MVGSGTSPCGLSWLSSGVMLVAIAKLFIHRSCHAPKEFQVRTMKALRGFSTNEQQSS
jgi:hypothetical protein